jgi:phage shock protein A
MNDKNLDRKANDLLDNVNDTIILLANKIEELENDLVILEKHREESIKLAYEKGYQEGVKYTDGIINDERFPF